jgi:hypothetical protein
MREGGNAAIFLRIGKPIHIVYVLFLILLVAAPKIADADSGAAIHGTAEGFEE